MRQDMQFALDQDSIWVYKAPDVENIVDKDPNIFLQSKRYYIRHNTWTTINTSPGMNPYSWWLDTTGELLARQWPSTDQRQDESRDHANEILPTVAASWNVYQSASFYTELHSVDVEVVLINHQGRRLGDGRQRCPLCWHPRILLCHARRTCYYPAGMCGEFHMVYPHVDWYLSKQETLSSSYLNTRAQCVPRVLSRIL